MRRFPEVFVSILPPVAMWWTTVIAGLGDGLSCGTGPGVGFSIAVAIPLCRPAAEVRQGRFAAEKQTSEFGVRMSVRTGKADVVFEGQLAVRSK